jgi:SAM-dependent methyltransferase
MRKHDWASLLAMAAVAATVVALIGGHLGWAAMWLVVAIAGGMAARTWSRRDPGPMPYALRWTLYLVPHAPAQLSKLLEPADGERLLEVGPGVGHHALAVAGALAPRGTLDVLDLQQEMLDALLRRAAAAGITNIAAKQGSAHELPYPDAAFDGAYLSAVLGEIPNQSQALRELRRVLRSNGRLVITEGILDPDYVSFAALQKLAAAAGFVFERKRGPGFAYMARFRAAERPLSGA